MASVWTPDSWKKFPAKQQPVWPDEQRLEKMLSILRLRLPLVFSGEIERLKKKLALAAKGEMFLLQGGDCAERFSPSLIEIENKLRILMQMAMVLMYGAAKPVIKVGRFAGQYAKPRSKPVENIEGQEMASYFGDLINRPDPTLSSRTPEPKNLLDAYNFSASTLNIIRGLSVGGFADLHKVHAWNKEFVLHSSEGQHYEEIADGISRALDFMQACGIDSPEVGGTDFYTSHEALVLEYESALTRQDSPDSAWYDLSGHMLWIGARTADPNGAHVQFLRGVKNPIGIKVGPDLGIEALLEMLDVLNPDNEWGRINLITRFGAQQVVEQLPAIIRAVQKSGHNLLWSCDPMHGNTRTTPEGYKTRDFGDVLSELKSFFEIHHSEGTIAGGVHLELTGDDVTECTGGAEKLTESSLKENYLTACDPRLNAKQALELAFLIAKELRV